MNQEATDITKAANITETSSPLDAPWRWTANIELILSASTRGTRLRRCRHNGPLYVQKPFYPEGADYAHVYLLHPPGGMVSGDTLTTHVTLEDHAHSVITTPGAARAYRARDSLAEQSPIQKQTIHLSVGMGASLEWFPMETIIYPGAAAELATEVTLQSDSTFMGWEVTCLGLPASNDLMTEGYLSQRYRIFRDGLPLFIDHLHFDAHNTALFQQAAGMQGKTVSGFFIAGPFNDSMSPEGCSETSCYDKEQYCVDQLRQILQEHKLAEKIAVSCMNHFFVMRYLGDSANQARDGFSLLWEALRPVLLSRQASKPRIWLT